LSLLWPHWRLPVAARKNPSQHLPHQRLPRLLLLPPRLPRLLPSQAKTLRLLLVRPRLPLRHPLRQHQTSLPRSKAFLTKKADRTGRLFI
jgi:hypothetical protein